MPVRAAPPSSSSTRSRPGASATRVRRLPGTAAQRGGRGLGGFFGNIGTGLKDLAVGSAVGTVALGKAAFEDIGKAEAMWDPLVGEKEKREARRRQWRTDDIATAIGKDYAHRYGALAHGDFSQLYDDPVSFALDALAVASLGAGSVARVSAAGKAAKAGQSARVVGRALRHGPPTELRYVKAPDTEARALLGTYSRSAATRGVQKFLDGIRQQFPNAPILGRSLYRKIGFQGQRLAEIDERIGRIGAEELLAVAGGRKLNAAQHRALRIVAEGVSIDKRIARHRADLAAAKTIRQSKRLRGEIRLLEKARKYVNEGTLTDSRLQEIYDLAKISTKRREDLLAKVDELAPGRAAARIKKPAEHFGEPGAGEMFFTYSSKKKPTSFARLGAARVIRHPQKPGTGKPFTGEAITQGRVPRGEAILAAESELEAWRFTTILRNRDRLISLAKPQPTKGSDIAIVLDELKGQRLPEEARAFLGKVAESEVLPEEQVAAAARIGEGLRQAIFPGSWRELQYLERYRAAGAEAIPGVVWIDKRLLGGLNATNPLVGFSGNFAAKAVLGLVDMINNAQKAAILYLLPLKYITPNAISQAAFALIQQGFAAPRHLAAAAKLNAKLGRKAQLAIDAGMMEGFAASIAGSTGGPFSKLDANAARFYGKIIDTPFRRASFLHEAERAGYATPSEIKQLLFDPKLRDRRNAIFLEANSEIIDYARLGRVERNIIRRVIFFYPWVKGATVYGARFVVEHPIKAAALDAIGHVGTAEQERVLGEFLPSYAEALAPIGESGGLPTTLNLAAVSPFTTPYSSLRAALGDTRSGYALGSQFSPALNALIMATGFTPPGGYTYGPKAALNELYMGLPEYRYPRRILGGTKPSYVYPTTPTQDWLSLFFGTGVTPRRTNPRRLREEAKKGR